MSPLLTILPQYAADAAFLWLLRDAAVRAPHYTLDDLVRLDDRIEAHLDGLRVAGDAGWESCREELTWEEPGEVFAAGVLAFGSDKIERIQLVLEAARKEATPELIRGLIAALGWLPYDQVGARIKQMCAGNAPDVKRICLAASCAHRVDPGKALDSAIDADDPLLRAAALRAAGLLGRRAILPRLSAHFADEDISCCLWAQWSAGLLGEKKVVEPLHDLVAAEAPRCEVALDLALRLLDIEAANGWRIALAKDAKTLRTAVIASGIIGDPVAVSWLIEQMTDAKLARVAGESFTTISGIDLSLAKMESKPPPEVETGPNDNPEDENVALDADENLPWPDRGKVAVWWKSHSGEFRAGTRCFLGLPITVENLRSALRSTDQRRRMAAAIELTLRNPGQPLFETRAPGLRQRRILATS